MKNHFLQPGSAWQTTQRGGAKLGAGRTTELLNQRPMTALEMVAEQFPDWSLLLQFAIIANDETLDPSIRLDAAKAAAPFMETRPKPVERDPAALVDFQRQLAEVRNPAKGQSQNTLDDLVERLARAKQRARSRQDRDPRAPFQGPSDLIDGQSEP